MNFRNILNINEPLVFHKDFNWAFVIVFHLDRGFYNSVFVINLAETLPFNLC